MSGISGVPSKGSFSFGGYACSHLHGFVVDEPVVEIEGELVRGCVRPGASHQRAKVRAAGQHETMKWVLLCRKKNKKIKNYL